MALHFTSTNPSLLEVGHLKVISDTYAAVPKEYPQIFYEMTATKKTETVPHLGALSPWREGNEGGAFNSDEIVEGDTATFTPVIYNNSYAITFESQKYDQYGKIGAEPAAMGRGLRYVEEQAAANVINNGFAVTRGYDGEYLFSNSHPLVSSSASGDNLASGAISYSNVKAAKLLLQNTVNEANIPIMARATTLWCAANIEADAYEILSSTNIAGELSNTKNVLPKMGPLKVACLSLLTDGYWGVKDDNFASNNLIFMWFVKPMYGVQDVPGTLNRMVWGYAAFNVGYADYRGIVGSTGA